MDVATITMDRTEARKAFLEYRSSVRSRHDAEDEAIMRGYRVLAKGQPLLNLPEVMKTAGLNNEGMPKLAVGRADTEWAHVQAGMSGSALFCHEGNHWGMHAYVSRKCFLFPSETFDMEPWITEYQHGQGWIRGYRSRARALVPKVPPAMRPATHLRNFVMLWEAEWERVPPRDPMLLKPLGESLYAVVAVWDLTEVERAVLQGRF